MFLSPEAILFQQEVHELFRVRIAQSGTTVYRGTGRKMRRASRGSGYCVAAESAKGITIHNDFGEGTGPQILKGPVGCGWHFGFFSQFDGKITDMLWGE